MREPVPFATRCVCGTPLAKGATAIRDGREWRDCTACRPRDYDTRHGGPHDRGSADSYFMKPFKPHFFLGATNNSILMLDLTPDELEAYEAGWTENEASGNRKDWG